MENLRGHIPPKALDDVRLIASELVTNSVRHGQAGPGGRVHLRIEVEHDTVRVEVTDPGPGLPRRRPDPREDQTGGWGLVVVERLSDRWGVQPGRPSAVWAEVKTSSRGAS